MGKILKAVSKKVQKLSGIWHKTFYGLSDLLLSLIFFSLKFYMTLLIFQYKAFLLFSTHIQFNVKPIFAYAWTEVNYKKIRNNVSSKKKMRENIILLIGLYCCLVATLHIIRVSQTYCCMVCHSLESPALSKYSCILDYCSNNKIKKLKIQRI